jgi:hypothetical protein
MERKFKLTQTLLLKCERRNIVSVSHCVFMSALSFNRKFYFMQG